MPSHRILLYILVFIVGYVAARYFPQAANAAGLP